RGAHPQGVWTAHPPGENGPAAAAGGTTASPSGAAAAAARGSHPGAARADPPATLLAPGQGGPRHLALRESEAPQCAGAGAAEIARGAQPADPGRNARTAGRA